MNGTYGTELCLFVTNRDAGPGAVCFHNLNILKKGLAFTADNSRAGGTGSAVTGRHLKLARNGPRFSTRAGSRPGPLSSEGHYEPGITGMMTQPPALRPVRLGVDLVGP